MAMRFIVYVALCLESTLAFHQICVVGASSGLGKELMYQSIVQHNKTVLALTNSPPSSITYPSRKNSFTENHNRDKFKNVKLTVQNYWESNYHTYEHLIIATKSLPFEYDYTAALMERMIRYLPSSCKSVTWVAPSEEWYIHPSTKKQREIFKTVPRRMKRFKHSPKYLTNDATHSGNAIERKELAERILKDINSL